MSPPAAAAKERGALMRRMDAAQHRGRSVRLRAAVRLENPGPTDRAQLRLRVERSGGEPGFYDDMGDRPIASGSWQTYEIEGDVAADAQAFEIGILLSGKARVWVDPVALEILGPADTAAQAAFQKLYGQVDATYAVGNPHAIAALATADAQVVIGADRMALAAILAQVGADLRQGARYESHSAVTAVRVRGSEASVSVNNQTTVTSPTATRTAASASRDTWVKTDAGWKLRQSTLIATSLGTPLTGPETTRRVAAEVRQRAAALPDGIAALGQAIGDARIVARRGVLRHAGVRRNQSAGDRVSDRAPEVFGRGHRSQLDGGARPRPLHQDRRRGRDRGTGEAECLAMGNGGDAGAGAMGARVQRRSRTAPGRELRRFRHAARLAGNGQAFRAEPMAGNVEWLAAAHPGEKIVLWTHNANVSGAGGAMGSWLRQRYGRQLYTVGCAFRGGELRAVENGNVVIHRAAVSGEGTGDAVLSAAGMLAFFLDLRRVPAESALGVWLNQPHLFHLNGVMWSEALTPQAPAQLYDGLIFVEKSHPTTELPGNPSLLPAPWATIRPPDMGRPGHLVSAP